MGAPLVVKPCKKGNNNQLWTQISVPKSSPNPQFPMDGDTGLYVGGVSICCVHFIEDLEWRATQIYDYICVCAWA